MNDIVRQILFYVVVFLSNIIQCITGFAGTVLAMPASLMLVGYNTAKPVLNVLGILASIGVVIFNYKHINWKEFLKITLIMLPGMAIGFVIIRYLPISKSILYYILSGIILLFTGIGIYTTFFKKEKEEKNSLFMDILMYAILVASGCVHGMFVCGGPLLIIYASKKLKEKDQFRATLSMCWIVLNSIILGLDIYNGYYNAEVLPSMLMYIGISAVVLIAALVIGNLIAKKMSRRVFLIITYVLMVISAISLILNACGVM